MTLDTDAFAQEQDITELFPFNSFRPYQQKVLIQARNAFEHGKEVVIIEGPTGFGKSPVNIALGKYFKPSFYTTPQVKLVRQVAKDFGERKLAIDGGEGPIMTLLGRNNYICRASGQPSDKCRLRNTAKCSEQDKCTYWRQKAATLEADVAILTFAMLIVNSYIMGGGKFTPRDLLIVDECHSLEGQTASMFAGVAISPYAVPGEVRDKFWSKVKNKLPTSTRMEDYLTVLKQVDSICLNLTMECWEKTNQEKIRNYRRKLSYVLKEYEKGHTWVVNRKKVRWKGKTYVRPKFKPIKVSRFLRRHVWGQARKILLTSATVPFRSNIQRWLYRIGLGDKPFAFLKAPMSFPVKHRPIITSSIGGKMTCSNEHRNWKRNIRTVKRIIKKHKNERGVIHTQSYKRAKHVARSLFGYSVFLHDKKKIDGDVIDAWSASRKKILLSPAVSEGVDLKDELCRYQILLKVPYPSVGDARVKYLLDKKKDWKWYYSEASRDIVQMYGRAVRSHDDHAILYVIDGSFHDILRKSSFPKWFLEALQSNTIQN